METTNQIFHFEWEQNLSQLKQSFLQIKQKSKSKTNRQMIQELNNKKIKADYVLVRQFLQNYSKQQQLQKIATFQQMESFFQLLKQKYIEVEQNYLKQQEKYIEKDDTQGNQQNNLEVKSENQINFNLNKINLSKFIKDEHEFYKKSVQRNLEKSKQDKQQSVISGQKLAQLIKTLLFTNNHLKLFKLNQNFFELQNFQQQIKQTINHYAVKVREQQQKQDDNFSQFNLTEDQILEFLTFWLRESSESISPLKIIYSRTENIEKKLVEAYLASLNSNQKMQRDSKLLPQKIENINQFSASQNPSNQNQNQQITHKIEKAIKNQRVKSKSTLQELPAQSILNKYRQIQSHQSNIQRSESSKSLTKQQKIQKIIPQLFTFACKKRVRMNKHTTFDSIQEQSKFMNLQKFMNFCNDTLISDLFERNFLIDQFKAHAINRLTLNCQKFSLLLKKLIQKNPDMADKLLNSQKIAFIKRKKQVNKLTESTDKKLSKYYYELRPVNGRDIQSIQLQLAQKKKMKQFEKKQKMETLLKRKQGYLERFHKITQGLKQKQPVNQSNSQSSFAKINESFNYPNQNSKIEVNKKPRNYSQRFNPESLISNFGEEDKLWDQYESKIWKKDKASQNPTKFPKFNQIKKNYRNQSENQSILQEALSKRIQRGNKVLKKIASTNLKYYI